MYAHTRQFQKRVRNHKNAKDLLYALATISAKKSRRALVYPLYLLLDGSLSKERLYLKVDLV